MLREGDREEAANQYGPQHREHRDEVGVADSSEATLVQESHEEAESDENHHVHILKEGVTRHLRWRGVLSEQTIEKFYFPSCHLRSLSPTLPVSEAVAPGVRGKQEPTAQRPLPVLRRAPTLSDEQRQQRVGLRALSPVRAVAEEREGETPGKLRIRHFKAHPAVSRKAHNRV